jgi:hypothetical protein
MFQEILPASLGGFSENNPLRNKLILVGGRTHSLPDRTVDTPPEFVMNVLEIKRSEMASTASLHKWHPQPPYINGIHSLLT